MQRRIVYLNLEGGSRQKWTIYPIGDVHDGAAACDLKELKKTIKAVQDTPNTFWIGMGDFNDWISTNDPRFTPDAVSEDEKTHWRKQWLQNTNRKTAQRYEPIADKCLGLLDGNHELNIIKRYFFSPTEDLAQRIGQVRKDNADDLYLGYEGFIKIHIIQNFRKNKAPKQRYSLTIYCNHGFGGGKMPGSHANNLLNLATQIDADVYIMGHNHNMQSFMKPRLGITERGRYIKKPMAFLNSGTFLKSKMLGHDTYEVLKGYPPTTVGCPHINIKPDSETGDMAIELVCKQTYS